LLNQEIAAAMSLASRPSPVIGVASPPLGSPVALKAVLEVKTIDPQ
jgi:hypothetical protein